jgi:chromatin segregation and condensation protein Rec8/ScpA/Scc1 (kleisin family)
VITVRLGGAAAAFDGPLDLLLGLVRRNQYPLDRLPVAEITRQYGASLEELREHAPEFDVESGAAFIEVASWLVLLKSRALLPVADTGAATDAEESPEQELRRVLLDHATLRRTTALLAERMRQAGLSSGGGAPSALPPQEAEAADGSASAGVAASPPTVYDALLSARRALEALRAHAAAAAEAPAPERYPVDAELRRLLGELASLPPDRATSTAAWFAARPEPEARVALLLALLEAARMHTVVLGQPRSFGPIYLKQNAG